MRALLAHDPYNPRKTQDLLVSLGIFAAVALIPLFVEMQYWIGVITVSMYYALAAMGWNLLAGYTGQYSIAPAAFAMLGAYGSALSGKYLGFPPVLGIMVGVVVTGILGIALGRAAFKLRGAYLALTTIAFGEIARHVMRNSYDITRGNLGMSVPPLFGGMSDVSYFYLFLSLCILVQIGLWALIHSRVGLFLQAIREDEVAALGRGVSVIWWKSIAFGISTAICGLAGGVYVHFLQLAQPKMGMIIESGLIIMAAVFGGMGTLVGPFIGGLIVKPLAEFARGFNAQHMLILGFLGILIMRFFRDGLYGFVLLVAGKLRRRWTGTPRSREEAAE